MEQVTAFKASDGAIFETVDQCQEHEVSLLWRQRVDDFYASPLNPYPNGGAQSGMARKVIVAWERFKTGA